MNQSTKVIIAVIIVVIIIVGGIYLWQQNNEVKETNTNNTIQPTQLGYQISGIEEGGYSGTAYCSIINKAVYTIGANTITIDDKGPYQIKINEMRKTFSPYEYPNINLMLHIRFDDKENTYADILYIGADKNLYNCRGGV